jgi:cysteine desulfuration protein SufE
MNRIAEIINEFQSVDDDFKLELLLDYANKLPPVPDNFSAIINQENKLVSECQTPVHLVVQYADHKIRIYAEVPPESPTVRGIVSLLIHAYDGATPEEVLTTPTNLLQKLGLAEKIGAMRSYGIGAIIQRLKNEVRKAASTI